MTRSLKGKMILSYLAVALLTVLVVSSLIRLTSGRSLMNLVVEEQTASLQEAVQSYYITNGSLNGFFESTFPDMRDNPPPAEPDGKFDKSVPPGGVDFRGLAGLVDPQYRALTPTLGYQIGELIPRELIRRQIEVQVDGQTIAWILPDTKFEFRLSAEEQLFLQRTNLAIGLAALAGVGAALAIGFFLAGRLLNPIRLLTRASQAMARGDLQQQVPVASRDELGQLTATFNQMSTDLLRADQQRKRLTADITHDLSTPLQIISGYIEMMEAGDAQLTPQRVEIIKTELDHLRRLVGDLTMLAQVEAGGLEMLIEPVDVSALLERVYQAFQPIAAQQGVALTLNLPDSSPVIALDEGRMEQVLKNLLENALRHTPGGGSVELGARSDPLEIWVKDSGMGIDADDLPYVFDRFYRADKARGAGSGKMGLGLAICKALVSAQGGSISAHSAGKAQGASILIHFDAQPS